jgi:cyanophycin synthetase
MNITQILFDQVERRPESLAIRHASGDLNYREFGSRVASAASGLLNAGVQVREVVAICLDDQLEHWTATLALAHIGATVVSIPRSMPDAQRKRLLDLTSCTRALIGEGHIATGAISGFSPIQWSDVVKFGDCVSPEPTLVEADQPWIYVNGSGSTGRPKIMPVSHEQQIARSTLALSWVPYDSDDVLVSLVSMNFYSAKQRCLEAIVSGAAVYIGENGRVDFQREVSSGAITAIFSAVSHIERLLSLISNDKSHCYSNLKALLVVGSTVSMTLRNEIRRRVTDKLYVLWGTNESHTGTITRLSEVFQTRDNVGHFFPGFEVEVVDCKGQKVAAGTDGQIRLTSPTLISGYLGDPEATQKAFRDGWFYPGDIGHFTADGQLVHRGRADDMMIVSGVNVYPAEIEECLRRYPGVEDVLATPLRHPQVQDLPVALVVCSAGVGLNAHALVDYVRTQIGRHTLYDLVFVDCIPRNEQGKVQRELVTKILHAKWGANQTDSNVPATRSRKQLTAMTGTLTLGFKLPPQPRPEALTDWIALLDDQLLSLQVSHQQQSAASEGEQWLSQVLLLAVGLLHVVRMPFFDPVEIVQYQGAEGPIDQCQAICRSPDPTLVPAPLWEGVIKVTFKLAAWAVKASIDSDADRQHFFGVIEAEVIKAFIKFRPKGKSTFEVLRVAHRRGIPYFPLPGDVFQLGWGRNARRIDRSTTDHDSAMGSRWTHNKLFSAQLLIQAGLPAPRHFKVETPQQAKEAAERLGYPVVVKPADQERGEGVSVDIGPDILEVAFHEAHKRSPSKSVLVEQQVAGVCHRLFIAAGELLYAVKRLPIGLYADGQSTIGALVALECASQQRLPPWKRSGIRSIDDLAIKMLNLQGWSLDSTPARGKFIALRRIESTAWGGVDEDVSNTIHPDNVKAALAACKLFGLEVAGVDIISPDITEPWHSNGAIINEVNFAPLLGGGEISRSHIPAFLNKLLKAGGRIPIHVHVGGKQAGMNAHKAWKQLVDSGLGATFVGDDQLLTPSGDLQMRCVNGLYAKCRALLLLPDLDAIVLWVQSDEFVKTGLPFDRITSLHESEGALVSFLERRELDALESRHLLALLRSWKIGDNNDTEDLLKTKSTLFI